MARCIHYNGCLANGSCKAGVDYMELIHKNGKVQRGQYKFLPCRDERPEAVPCEKKEVSHGPQQS